MAKYLISIKDSYSIRQGNGDSVSNWIDAGYKVRRTHGVDELTAEALVEKLNNAQDSIEKFMKKGLLK